MVKAEPVRPSTRSGGADLDADQPPKVTVSHLRRAGTMCPRRLAHEHGDHRGMNLGSGRFRVEQRLLEDARLCQVDVASPSIGAFRADALTDEERRLYEHAAAWYVALYGDRPVRAADLPGDEEWSTTLDGLGVRLVGRCGLVVEDGDGRAEVRLLRLGSGVPAVLVDDADVRFVLLRLARWAGDRPLLVSVADVVQGARREDVVDVASRRADLDDWVAARVALIRERIAQPDPAPGSDCASCRFVPWCKAHT